MKLHSAALGSTAHQPSNQTLAGRGSRRVARTRIAHERVAANCHPIFNLSSYVDKDKASGIDVGALHENREILESAIFKNIKW